MLLWFGLFFAGLGPAQAEVPKEYQIKAAFLYNFTKFVEWPPERFADENSPIVIGVLGRNPFGDELEKNIAGRRAGGHPVVVRTVGSVEEVRTVHLLFVPEAGERRFDELAPELGSAAILTVGESELFDTLGGVIRFVRQADKVRFAINLEAGEARRLKISAQLLKLAVAVHRTP